MGERQACTLAWKRPREGTFLWCIGSLNRSADSERAFERNPYPFPEPLFFNFSALSISSFTQ